MGSLTGGLAAVAVILCQEVEERGEAVGTLMGLLPSFLQGEGPG